LNQEVAKESKKSNHVVEEKLNKMTRIVVGLGNPQEISRLDTVQSELRHLTLGDEELDGVQEIAEAALFTSEDSGEVVEVHEDVNEGVQLSREVSVTAGSLKGDEEPDDEDGGVVVKVEERNLTVVLLEHHDDGVDELGKLRDVEDPDELRHAPGVGVLEVNSDVPEGEAGSNSGDTDGEPHVGRESEEEEVVDHGEALDGQLAEDELANGVEGQDDEDVEGRGEEDAFGVHEGELLGEGVDVVLLPVVEPLHAGGGDLLQDGVVEGVDGGAEDGLELGGNAVHQPIRELDEFGDLLGDRLHFIILLQF